MAHIHSCGRVHPPGAVTCEQARQMIEKRGREIEHRVQHHGENHPGCRHSYDCVIREMRAEETERRKPFGPIGASV